MVPCNSSSLNESLDETRFALVKNPRAMVSPASVAMSSQPTRMVDMMNNIVKPSFLILCKAIAGRDSCSSFPTSISVLVHSLVTIL